MSDPTTTSSSSSNATATLVSTIPPALFLLVPLFTLALLLLALSHRPQQDKRTPPQPQARVAYAVIAALALLSTLAGALPLSRVGNTQAEAVVQAFLALLYAR
ncbi:hypothetical protein BDZ97DRAFT_1914203 [Flammula alnicola]|nr:hypothetical protein BDZ97DRAFT_1914203 [Flammula alnicola]